VSHVLQWKTNVPDFNTSSNSSSLKVTVLVVVVWTDDLKIQAVAHKPSYSALVFNQVAVKLMVAQARR
jgi:hypothetical protein